MQLGGIERAAAFQIGKQPYFQPDQYSIRFAPIHGRYTNLPIRERSMVLAVPPDSTLAPSIIEERDLGDGRRKIIRVRLTEGGNQTEVTIAIAMIAAAMEERRLYIHATDGTNTLTMIFPAAR